MPDTGDVPIVCDMSSDILSRPDGVVGAVIEVTGLGVQLQLALLGDVGVSKVFQKIFDDTQAKFRKLLGVPEGYKVLFLQGVQLQLALLGDVGVILVLRRGGHGNFAVLLGLFIGDGGEIAGDGALSSPELRRTWRPQDSPW